MNPPIRELELLRSPNAWNEPMLAMCRALYSNPKSRITNPGH